MLCEALIDRFPQLLLDWSVKLQAVQRAELTAMQKEVTAKSSELAVAESRLKAEKDLRDQERWSYERSLADQAKLAAQNDEHLKAMVRMWCLRGWEGREGGGERDIATSCWVVLAFEGENRRRRRTKQGVCGGLTGGAGRDFVARGMGLLCARTTLN